jgi:50S ribosomal subunit-associated GTPase HflX
LFFERPESGERAILVHIELAHEADRENPRELEELALSAGADPVEFLTGSRRSQPQILSWQRQGGGAWRTGASA